MYWLNFASSLVLLVPLLCVNGALVFHGENNGIPFCSNQIQKLVQQASSANIFMF